MGLSGRYISKPLLGGHPVLSGHFSIPRGCPLNKGFTVHQKLHNTDLNKQRLNKILSKQSKLYFL